MNTTPPAPHYLNLPGARTVTTSAVRAAAHALDQALAHRHLICVSADPGAGKTFTLHTLCRRPTTPTALWLLPRPRARPDDLRRTLHKALALQGAVPTDPGICDDYLRHTLRQSEHLLVVDEAHQLSASCIEYLRYHHDEPACRLTIVLLASRSRLRALRNQAALLSRTATWHHLLPLDADETSAVLPDFHPIWRDVPHTLISRLDTLWAHGNFRRWAALTHQLWAFRHRYPDRVPDPALLLHRLHPKAHEHNRHLH